MTQVWSDDIGQVDWDELSALYRVAPLGDKKSTDLQTVFTNSRFRCFVYEHGRLIGVGRALSDGLDCSYICDVAILPSHQNQGLGQAIVAKLVASSVGHKKIILYAVPGKEGFYKKLGFRHMTTAMAIFADQQAALDGGYVLEN